MIKNSFYNKKLILLLIRVLKYDVGEYNCIVEDIDMGRKIFFFGSFFVKGICFIEFIYF